MKKVRFDTVEKVQMFKMNDSECHSPRPFIERELLRPSPPDMPYDYPRVLTYQTDPVQRYESSNSSPYPIIPKTQIPSFIERESNMKPSDDLDLSMLDDSSYEPRKPAFCKSILKELDENKICGMPSNISESKKRSPVLSPLENNVANNPPNVLVKDNSFFIRRDNLDKFHFNVNPLQTRINGLSVGKENDPLVKKAEMMITDSSVVPYNSQNHTQTPKTNDLIIDDKCKCHHCVKPVVSFLNQQSQVHSEKQMHTNHTRKAMQHSCACSTPRVNICSCCNHIPHPIQQNICKSCNCHNPETPLQNAVDQKTRAIEKYEKSKHSDCMEVEKQTNISKEKREPTVADLFKIIKLQNEQLQLLQEKVDKFILSSRQNSKPTVTCSTEHVAVNSVENNPHKMSVGVMTSFEMIRTSTVINKEVLKQANDNSLLHCNRSQISIKEVVSNPVNLNFLEGIAPKNALQVKGNNDQNCVINRQQIENVNEEKTLNEISLYNVQVDNATTPLMSPEQTMYLDVRDYSDSDASNNDHSNVGWTYYNKVMTHVNGMLQDSEMPSSASAMFRNMRQQCVQMQIDKTNVSVTKRVKFGDVPVDVQPLVQPTPSDTSLKMNQLAAKYLQRARAPPPPPPPPPVCTAPNVDMSFATRNYMEKHRLLPGLPSTSNVPHQNEIPRFLDITALKQQPKFL